MANTSATLGISIAAIVIASIGIVIAITSMNDSDDFMEAKETYVPQTREVYLFSQVDEHIDEEA
ncbi:MAG TPA: hypothetical protein VD731_08660 [Nitrosopumilaceae archaeon]|nr:hypothetical protein [Nitrosopumilaceae archaeon]